MGILKLLQTAGSIFSINNGNTPPKMSGSEKTSKLHYQYSINGNPNIPNKPTPSNLDLNGQTPPKYTSNLPG